ncbi:MAG: MipA/OmpV family protein [Notoacmeibacter sp.]|nr:MipA/OmpV family protein [Notoacmeibacter sp.]MCC0033286.1 MipA/OmpV family protein [Brucellaceae bacterium]
MAGVKTLLPGAALLGALLPGTYAAAQDAPSEAPEPGIVFEAGGGLSVNPAYEGASSHVLNPWPIVRLKRLTLPNGYTIGGKDTGLSFKPSFRMLDARTAREFPRLSGLKPVQQAIELGLGASYTQRYWSVFADVRRGITGHDGYVGEAGANAIVRPVEGLTVTAGPRVSFASADYMKTYFGVRPGESVRSGMPVFKPDGGVKSVGAEVALRYDLDPEWAVEGAATYSRLIGDAARSPVTKKGSADQYGVRVGIVRTIELGF